MDISLIATLLKRLGAICLALVIFWHVTQHAAPRRGKAIVHVSQSDVVVFVDHQNYHISNYAESPVVCDLEPGDHQAQVWRHGILIGEERFTVEAGEEVVVPPFDRAGPDIDPALDRPVPTAERIRPAGLAARIREPEPTVVPNRGPDHPPGPPQSGTRGAGRAATRSL
jgi:hypothetical protein